MAKVVWLLVADSLSSWITKLIFLSPCPDPAAPDDTSLVMVVAGIDSVVGVRAVVPPPPLLPCPDAMDCAATDHRRLLVVATVRPDGVTAAVAGFVTGVTAVITFPEWPPWSRF